TRMTQTSTTTAGIDTSKSKLDVALHGRTGHWQVANSLAGWRELTVKLAAASVGRVGIEATGGYERGVVEHLRAAGCSRSRSRHMAGCICDAPRTMCWMRC
ncbi:MAG TPA: hypothetical protein VF583_07700, partial [Bradyrhizobium sp.]